MHKTKNLRLLRASRQLASSGFVLALLASACMDDPIVYPNRNLRAAAGASEADAGEAGAPLETGGAPLGGSGGKGGSSGGGAIGGSLVDDAGAAGTPAVGPECGNGTVEAGEECDDGNTISGDGCSADCHAACEECEKYVCPLLDLENPPATASAYEDCYRAKGKIKQGPATNVPRAEVCGELADCIREEQCSQLPGFQLNTKRCWCDVDWTDFSPTAHQVSTCQDPSTFVPGQCASLFQDASEGDKLTDVTRNLIGFESAEGEALRLIGTCDTRVCPEECLPSYFQPGFAATITADIVAAHNDAGESPLCDLVADAQRSKAQTDFALVRADAIIGQEVPALRYAKTPHRAADADGRLLWSEARAVSLGYAPQKYDGFPDGNVAFDADLLKVTLTGQQIYDALAQPLKGAGSPNNFLCVSGLTYTWDPSQPDASRLVAVKRDGVALDQAAQYTVALGGRLVAANGPILAIAGVQGGKVLEGAKPEELLGEYLSKLPQPVTPPVLNRITRLP